ncbi:Hypothetical predicted protein, partial [Olea europaea subsp. europaea]
LTAAPTDMPNTSANGPAQLTAARTDMASTSPDRSGHLVAAPIQSIRTSSFGLSPEDIRGYPKYVRDSKTVNKGRKRGETMIATDAPSMDEIRMKKKKAVSRLQTVKPKKLFKSKKIESKKNESSDSEIDEPEYMEMSDDPEDFSDLQELEILARDPEEGDYVIVKFKTGKALIHNVAKVISNRDVN